MRKHTPIPPFAIVGLTLFLAVGHAIFLAALTSGRVQGNPGEVNGTVSSVPADLVVAALGNGMAHATTPKGGAAKEPLLFEKDRPDWEIKFTDVSNSVLSVMPGESNKTFYDPLIKREIKWEQDVYCPTCAVFNDKLYCVYRS
jgi:hypothetical protein